MLFFPSFSFVSFLYPEHPTKRGFLYFFILIFLHFYICMLYFAAVFCFFFWLSYTCFISFFCSFLLFLLFISLITALLYYYYFFIIFLLYTLIIHTVRLIHKPYKILKPKNCRLFFFLCMFILEYIFNSPKFANFNTLKY